MQVLLVKFHNYVTYILYVAKKCQYSRFAETAVLCPQICTGRAITAPLLHTHAHVVISAQNPITYCQLLLDA